MKIKGVVISGKNKGEKIGFPTVNLEIGFEKRDSFESGVYSGEVFLPDGDKKAIIFIGSNKNILEAHILDFSGSLRGEEIEVEVGKKIRDVMIFSDDAALIDQIGRDIEKLRDVE